MNPLAPIAVLAILATTGAQAAESPPSWQGGAEGLAYRAGEGGFSSMDLECSDGRVIASVPAPNNAGAQLSASAEVHAGAVLRRYFAEVLRNGSETRLQFRALPRDPAMLAFRVTGGVSVNGGPDLVARTDAERTAIAEFLAACR